MVTGNNTLINQLESDDNNIENKSKKSRRISRNKYTIEEFMKGMTPEMNHEELDWGKPIGKEIW